MAESSKTISVNREIEDVWRTWFRNLSSAFRAFEKAAGIEAYGVTESAESGMAHLELQVPVPLRHAISEAIFRDRNEPNSLSASESLLCILLPADQLDEFSLVECRPTPSRPFGTRSLEFVNKLSGADSQDAKKFDPRALRKLLATWATYFIEYSTDTGRPTFHAASYLDPPESDQQGFLENRERTDVLDSYTFSVTLCLSVLSTLRRWTSSADARLTSAAELQLAEAVRTVASDRLTSSLVGLCAGFTVSDKIGTQEWQEATRLTWDEAKVATIKDRIADLFGEQFNLSRDNAAFEIGWTWSQLKDPIAVPNGIAIDNHLQRDQPVWPQPAPYFYFTLAALDGLTDLFQDRVQTEELLDGPQLVLAGRLRLLADLTTQYWRTMATDLERTLYQAKGRGIGRPGRMALEALPWRTADGDASDLWSLYLVGVLINELMSNRLPFGEQEFARLRRLVQELAERARIVREPLPLPGPTGELVPDPVVSHLQIDGKVGTLANLHDVDVFQWRIVDFVSQLFKRASQLSRFVKDWDERALLDELSQDIWTLNLSLRRIQRGRSKVPPSPGIEAFDVSRDRLWDDPARLPFVKPSMVDHLSWMTDEIQTEEGTPNHAPVGASWYITERVTEALVARAVAEKRQRYQDESLTRLIETLRESLLGSVPIATRPDLEQVLRQAQEKARAGDGAVALSEVLSTIDEVRTTAAQHRSGASAAE